MAQYVYTMDKVTKTIPPRRMILSNITLSFFPGAKIGVLGLNGSGKSSLLRIMAGIDNDFEGQARAQKGIRIGYLAQEPVLDASLDVRANVEQGVAEVRDLLRRFDAINEKFAEPMDEVAMTALLAQQGQLQDAIDTARAWDLDRQLEIAADALRLPPWDAAIGTLSGGERRRVALCQLLLSAPDMLLLDEPTNHLDAESVAWLERYLEEYAGTVIAVTHDRYFLDNVAGWILEIDRGRGIPWQGNYSSWLEQKEQRLVQEARDQSAHKRSLKAELEWVRANPKGRQQKSKARMARFDELCSREFQKRSETNQIYIPPGPRLGDRVIEAIGITKNFVNRLLIDDLNMLIPAGAIVGVIGPNGSGKTTLLRMIAGLETPDKGQLRIGETVSVAYVEQSREVLTDTDSAWQSVSGGQDLISVGNFQMPSRAYLGRFNFKGVDQEKRIASLSGGERNRLHLAKLLVKGANVLLLDEPTNDLDVETLRALEDALLDFPGVVITVSHDRWFLDRICTHILAFEQPAASPVWFEGNYQEYEIDQLKRLGNLPRRGRYKRLDA